MNEMNMLWSFATLTWVLSQTYASNPINDTSETRANNQSPISQDGLFTEYSPTLVSNKLSGEFAQTSVWAKGMINMFLNKENRDTEVEMVLLGKTEENMNKSDSSMKDNVDEDSANGKEEGVGIDDWLLRQYDKVRKMNQTSIRSNATAISINDELLWNTGMNIPCESDMMQFKTRRTDSSLEWFVARLKSFMVDTVFDYQAFELNGHQLEQILMETAEQVKMISSCDSNLTLKLLFAKRIFEVMSNSIELLRYYSTVNEVGHHVLYSILDLNVMLLTFFDSRGIPDLTIEGFAEKVATNIHYLIQWEAAFKEQRSPSFSKHLAFRKQWNQAKKTLQILSFSIPEEKRAFEKQELYFLKNQNPDTVTDPVELAKISPFSITIPEPDEEIYS